MKITAKKTVTLHQKVLTAEGELLDNGDQPVSYVHGGYHDIFDKIEAALDGKEPGDSISVQLAPEETYGPYDKRLVKTLPLDQFDTPPKVGQMVEREDWDQICRVIAIKDGKAVLDANHPFAGMTLIFNATVTDVRDATPEEICKADGGYLNASIKPLKSIKMALVYFLCIPIALVLFGGPLLEKFQDSVIGIIIVLLMLAILLGGIWSGIGKVRNIFRRGDMLRLSIEGLFWKLQSDQTLPWEQIAKVQRHSVGGNIWFSITKPDKTSFTFEPDDLSVEDAQVSQSLGFYLPAEKLEGF